MSKSNYEKPRVLRGGSWNDNLDLARSAFRDWDLPDVRDLNVGFRVVISNRKD